MHGHVEIVHTASQDSVTRAFMVRASIRKTVVHQRISHQRARVLYSFNTRSAWLVNIQSLYARLAWGHPTLSQTKLFVFKLPLILWDIQLSQHASDEWRDVLFEKILFESGWPKQKKDNRRQHYRTKPVICEKWIVASKICNIHPIN